MARAVRARSDENVGPRVRANEPPDEHASEGARTPAPSLSAPGPRELRVRAVRGEIKDMFAVFNWEQLCVLVFPRRLTRSFPSFSGPGHPVASSQSLLQHSILSDGSALSAKLF
ncbi:UDP-GalNAc:beta-1,3-N-acetylgalactosaminyltransferase 1 isoform X6 [Saccopteryx bilineata]|uniref:UDP-GalNAc:beta-1, 3-N-acetylgalactosaminyltransferase 1 isoform X6 n=1 Tax=Saccopteryx bilineata TaxID=59482 RepID=UPI00338FA9DA